MTQGRKTGGKDFQKGKAGGPGRPPTPPDLKEIKKLTNTESQLLLSKYLRMPLGEIEAMVDQTNGKVTATHLPAIDGIIVGLISKAAFFGDQHRLNFLLDRTIGRVTDKVQVSMPEPTIIRRRSGEVVELGAIVRDDDDGEDS